MSSWEKIIKVTSFGNGNLMLRNCFLTMILCVTVESYYTTISLLFCGQIVSFIQF